jgi:hypothetical protein
MCQAQYGGGGLSSPPSPSSGTASAPPSSASSAAAGTTGAPLAATPGNGTEQGSKTHTIIVAPTQGVLRFGMSLSFCRV